MFEWIEVRWVITAAIIIVLIILLDEWAYKEWKVQNPGHLFSHLRGKTITPIDPTRPPTTYYE